MSRGGAFLDRDGTIIDDVHYIGAPKLVRLRPGAARAIGRLNDAHLPVIVVTNQSGIARGLFTENDYERVRSRLAELLAAEGAWIDGTYMCPHHPDFGGICECRKPGTLLFRRAAEEHDLDLARSIYIGDRWRDVAPAKSLGGVAILVDGDATPPAERELARESGVEIASSLLEAVDVGLRSRR